MRLLGFASLVLIGDAAVAQRPEPFDIAITVEDVLAHGPLPQATPRARRREGLSRYAEAVPRSRGAYGKLAQDADTVLAAWRDIRLAVTASPI